MSASAGPLAGLTTARRRPYLAAAGVAVGAVVMTAGTFAPWLASGDSHRNLYSSVGVVQRLAGLGRPVALALDALPLTGLYCVLAGLAYLLGQRRVAAASMAVLAVVLGGLGVAVLSHRSSSPIRLLAVGPSVTVAGAALTLAGLLVAAVLRARAEHHRDAAAPGITPDDNNQNIHHRPRTMEFS
jgi:hypothetical protein